MVPKGVKNPAAVLAVYNALHDVKPTEDYQGQNYFEQNLKHQADIESAKMLNTRQYIAPYTEFDAGKIKFYSLISDIVEQHKDVTSTLKSYEAKAQAGVNSILNPSANSK